MKKMPTLRKARMRKWQEQVTLLTWNPKQIRKAK
jgi:hypothetical protein